MNDSFKERFAFAREWRDMTLQEIGDAFGIKPQAVWAWETGGKSGKSMPLPYRWEKLAKLLRVTEDWLFKGIGSHLDYDENATDSRQEYEDSVSPFDKPSGRRVPLIELEDITVSNGSVRLSKTTYPARPIHTKYPCGEDAAAFIMRDRSMEPKIDLGDVVIIDPSIAPIPRDLVLVHIIDRNQNVFRQFSYGTNAEVLLTPINSHWETFRFTAQEWASNTVFIGTMSESTKPRRT